MIPWTDFELNFLQISDPMCNLSLLLNLNSSICFGSVFFNLTELNQNYRNTKISVFLIRFGRLLLYFY